MKKFKGLTSAEVQASKNAHGDNRLSSKEANSLLSIFIEAFQDQWILILLAALGLKIIFNFVAMIFPAIGEANWYEAISLIFAILMSTGFSAVSQYRNEQKFNILQEEASKTNAKVYRDGKLKEILVDDIVKGDQILLQSGDKIPVDGIILEGKLKVNQAVLNGESEDATKLPLGDREEPDSSDLFTEFKVFRGTVVTSDEAVIEATQIGDNTVLGSINTSLQEDSKNSPSKEKLNKLARNIGVLGYSAGAAYSAINLVLGFISLNKANNLNGGSIFLLIIETILFAVTIIIMAVPEGLPMMLALVSSMNSGRLLAQNILVRHPDTIETAGYMNILFSDKTGTITEGKLSVVDFFLGDGTLYAATGETDAPDFDTMSDSLKAEIINGIGLNNDAMVADGNAVGSNATDRALLDFLIGRSQLDFDTNTITEKQQFNSATKFASVTTNDGKTYIKGAPEFILNDCYYYLDKDGHKQNFTDDIKARFQELSLEQANRSMRLLAILNTDGNDKVLIGIVCIRDNVRSSIKQTVETMNRAGVQVVMVTGDRKETAVAIAKEAGIVTGENDLVLTHDELSALSDQELKQQLPHLKVVSRALPMDKKRLIEVAQELDMVAGMTGDGVNDSPALKSADVGFSMGDGPEVAREASDIVILNNSLTSIEKAVLYGRTMSKSVSKFIIFQLTVNVTTIAMSLLSPLLGLKEPFTIIQILWVNLIMDTLAALAFGEEPALDRYMNEKPVAKKTNILTGYMKSAIGVASAFITLVCLAILKNVGGIQDFITNGTGNFEMVTTFTFTVFIYAVIFNSFNTRSNGFNIFEHIGKNKKFLIVMISIAVVQTLIIQFGGKVFSTVPMDIQHYIIALLIAVLIIPADFIRKALTKNK
ncbi:calcium-translocating P-type ATPase, PMCA-type [Streptococcus thermophilus]|uniref:calcium-translocating P-type ATPase, PMCA-type n=1 Tax=Streptococcus thermophilus TaxID=1308 RepID=UPI0015C25D73|nr:calcium-translocating P-type ATPase, PMCA-type [Streptococcus thermophilus]MCT2950114.1 calcium-translocating P-type ATPase, PMCA-type [Streptococcus thermophilus]CAD0121642.1 Ca2+ Mn2+-P-type ATPase [Streptococcus thermophilus]